MTYAIKFVNFTLAAPFQKKSRPLMGGVRELHVLYGSYAHEPFLKISNPFECFCTKLLAHTLYTSFVYTV